MCSKEYIASIYLIFSVGWFVNPNIISRFETFFTKDDIGR